MGALLARKFAKIERLMYRDLFMYYSIPKESFEATTSQELRQAVERFSASVSNPSIPLTHLWGNVMLPGLKDGSLSTTDANNMVTLIRINPYFIEFFSVQHLGVEFWEEIKDATEIWRPQN